jgi:competence ComEA-like helix-hairpin-helix protein
MLDRGLRVIAGGRICRWRGRIAVVVLTCMMAITSPAAQKHPPGQPLDLNAATAEQFEQLPGIGPGTAKAIIAFREKSGSFRRVEDLLAIRGITKQRLEKIRPYLVVNSPPKPAASR